MNGKIFKDRCNVLINGSGVVNEWKCEQLISHVTTCELINVFSGPAIEGRDSYQGQIAHSANWDQAIDWKDKRVAILGTGSSSIQMVPHLAQG